MANHVKGTSPLNSGLPISLGELRQHILIALLSNPLFSEAEQLRANYFVHECDDTTHLTRWEASVRTEITRREAAADYQRGQYALYATLRGLRLASFCGHRPRPDDPTPAAWVPGTCFFDRADRRAGTLDRHATARFQPVDSLTLPCLLNRQPR